MTTRDSLNGHLRNPIDTTKLLCKEYVPHFPSQKTPVEVDLLNEETTTFSLSQVGPEDKKTPGWPRGSTKLQLYARKEREGMFRQDCTSIHYQNKWIYPTWKLFAQKLASRCNWFKKDDYNVPSLLVNYKTLYSWMARNNTTPKHWGPVSPVAAMEPILFQICIKMGNDHQPLTSLEGLELANSLIEGKPIQQSLMKFQLTCKREVTGKLGMKYWSAFWEGIQPNLSQNKGNSLLWIKAIGQSSHT